MIYFIMLAGAFAVLAFMDWKRVWNLFQFSREVDKPYEDAQTMTADDLKRRQDKP